jgi:hypothetical protein
MEQSDWIIHGMSATLSWGFFGQKGNRSDRRRLTGLSRSLIQGRGRIADPQIIEK